MRAYVNSSGEIHLIASDAAVAPQGFVAAPLDHTAAGAGPRDLVFDGVSVRHRASVATWYIDADGRWFATPGPERQAIQIQWGTPVVKDDTMWRPQSESEIRAPILKAQCESLILAVLSRNTQANLNGYANKLLKKSMSEELNDGERADLDAAEAAFDWVQNMVAVCREAISSGYEPEWPSASVDVVAIAGRF